MATAATGLWKSGNGVTAVTMISVHDSADAEAYFQAKVTIEGRPEALELALQG